MEKNGVRQHLAAILAADAVGYSRLMSLDERGTVAALDAAREVFGRIVAAHEGRIIDTAGDSVLATFESASSAVLAAIEVQGALKATQSSLPRERRMHFRIGVNLGEVIEKPDGSIYGDGVNIAARLQAMAEPGGVTMSQPVFTAIRGTVKAAVEDLGPKRLKNIAEPVRLFRVRGGPVGRGALPSWLWKRALVAAVVLAVVGGGWVAVRDPAHGARALLASVLGKGAPQPESERPVIAVLPFANLSGDPKRDYFSDGITEDIIGALGRFSSLVVISQNSVRGYRDASASPQRLGKDLGARYIVQGSVREAQGKMRVAVELSDADKGLVLWSERYDGEGSELFEIQDRIVRNVAASLQAKLTQLEQQRVFTRPTESLEAYDLVLRARSLLDRLDRGANREARLLLERARSLAPEYAEILTALGEAEVQRALYGWIEDPAEAMQRAEGLAKRVLASPDARAHTRAYVLLGRIHSNLANYAEAMRYADQAIAANPSDSTAMFLRGAALLYSDRVDESIVVLERAMRIDPALNAGSGQILATAYIVRGRFQEALTLTDLLVVRFPRDVAMHAVRTASLVGLGRLEDARQAAERVRRLSPLFQVENFWGRFANPELTARLRDDLRAAGL